MQDIFVIKIFRFIVRKRSRRTKERQTCMTCILWNDNDKRKAVVFKKTDKEKM